MNPLFDIDSPMDGRHGYGTAQSDRKKKEFY